MNAAPYTAGFVYVLTNESMPGLVKIGMTQNLPEDRALSLYSTGVPSEFRVAFRATTSRPRAVELRAHGLLDSYRANAKREFFRVSVKTAIEAVHQALIDAGGIESWKTPKRHIIRAGDRLSLTLKAGQAFALIIYRDLNQLIAGSAEILDLWQAHSDGDVLELFGTESAAHVTEFGDEAAENTDDPVPYLNRDSTAPNGCINGLSLLMPGERLVWLPAPEESEIEESVVFETSDHCQVVSRTWNPLVDADGFPLLLNTFRHSAVWSAAGRSVREVLTLKVPSCWAPREGRDSAWAPLGTEPPVANHWLPQLNPKVRKR